VKYLVALALAVMLMVTLTACGGAAKPGDTAAMPASSSDLKGEDYQDVVARLQSAGFTSVTTATIDDLVVGWVTKDGEVEKVSVNGATDFQANSVFPKGAEIVVTYHTFPKQATDSTERSSTTVVETPTSATADVDTTILTAANNEELKAILSIKDESDPRILAFTQKYTGRTIEFDGYTWDWIKVTGYDTIYSTTIFVGDVKNADTQMGPIFRVERYPWPNFVPGLNRMNVHVKATVDGYDADKSFFMITPVSLEATTTTEPPTTTTEAVTTTEAPTTTEEPIPDVPAEYLDALSQAEDYSEMMHMSKKGIYDQLVSEYGGQFSKAAAQYAADHVEADWNANALAQAKDYREMMHMSPAAIHDQLTSQYGGQFTKSQADYAIKHLND
jgi:hypothetical protein